MVLVPLMNQDDIDRIIKRQAKAERIETACLVLVIIGLLAVVIIAIWKG